MTLSPLLSTADLAEAWKISPNTVRTLVYSDHLPAVKIGRVLRFKPEDVDAWLNSRRPDVAPATDPRVLFPPFATPEASTR